MAPLTLPAALCAPARRVAAARARRSVARAALDYSDLADPTVRPSKVEQARRRLDASKPPPAPKRAAQQTANGTAKFSFGQTPQSVAPPQPPAAQEGGGEAERDRLAPIVALLLLTWAIGGAVLDDRLQRAVLEDGFEVDTEESPSALFDADADAPDAADGALAAAMALRAPPPAAGVVAVPPLPQWASWRATVVTLPGPAASDPALAPAPPAGGESLEDAEEAAESYDQGEEEDLLPLALGALCSPLLVLAARGELKLPSPPPALGAKAAAAAAPPRTKAAVAAAARQAPRSQPKPSQAGAAARSAAAQARLAAQRDEAGRLVRAKLAASAKAGKTAPDSSLEASLRRFWDTYWRQ